jgi:hypothetical protein
LDASLVLTIGGLIALGVGSLAVVFATFRTNTSRVWREEADAQKTRADRVLGELEKVTQELTELKEYTHTLVRLLSTVDPQKLEELRLRRGL